MLWVDGSGTKGGLGVGSSDLGEEVVGSGFGWVSSADLCSAVGHQL